MSLATARLFAILCPIDGGALPKWKPKVAGDHAALRFSLCRWGQTQLLGPKSTPGEPSDIGRIGMLEQSGHCCSASPHHHAPAPATQSHAVSAPVHGPTGPAQHRKSTLAV